MIMSEKPEQRTKVTVRNIEQPEPIDKQDPKPVKVTDRQSKSKDSASLTGVNSGF
jgi:hypothetical protein